PSAGIALSRMAAEARPDTLEDMGRRGQALANDVADRMGWLSA
ncbi:IclR family transcriptional regulator, partial [Brucella oryzae]